jgi:hypothetical protein
MCMRTLELGIKVCLVPFILRVEEVDFMRIV